MLDPSELERFPSLEWTDIAPRLSSPVRAALERALETLDGSALVPEQALLLARVEGDDLLGLLVAANELRRELAGNIVTYVVNRNINFTNICFVGCKFCAFSRGPRELDTYFLSPDQVAQKAIEAWELGATEVCIQGGLPSWPASVLLSRHSARRERRAAAHAHPRLLPHGDHVRHRTHGDAACRLPVHVA